MPVYIEMIKDKKTGKRKEKKIDGQNQYFIKTYVKDQFGNNKQITRRNKEWIGRSGYRKAQQEEIRLINKATIEYDDILVETLIKKFLDYKKDIIKYSSYEKYCSDIKDYIIPYFPIAKRANKVTTGDVLNWEEKLNKLTLANITKRRIYTTLSSIFKYGCIYYNLEKNVVSLVDNFKDKKGSVKEMNFLTEDEFNKFIFYEENKLYRDFFTVLFYTGMRRGELLALTYDNIDINNNTITICKTYNPRFEKIGMAESVPKTNKSNRTIQMLGIVKEIFKLYNNSGRIFDGIKLTTLKRKCDNNCKKAGITKKIRIHDFRHSFASLCIDKEVPIAVISEYLGHENISITLDTYSHLYPNSQYKLLDKFN